MVDDMKPILYEATERKFSSNGLGRLASAIDCHVKEARNGEYILTLKYPVKGFLYSEIKLGRIIGAIHDDKHDIQPFIIYQASKPINGVVTFYAHHLSYRLRNVILKPFTASSCAQALSMLETETYNTNFFSFWTDKEVNATFTNDAPTAVRSVLAGQAGSILDTYGTGEYEFDKWTVKLHTNRGNDNGVAIRYGVNLTDITQQIDDGDSYSAVAPFWRDSESGNVVMLPEGYVVANNLPITAVPWQDNNGETMTDDNGEPIYFSYTNVVPIPLDLTDSFEEEPTVAQLREKALSRLNSSEAWLPGENIKVSFVDLAHTENYKSTYASVGPAEMVHVDDALSANAKKITVAIDSESGVTGARITVTNELPPDGVYAFEPTQAGTGDPSPDNIREITPGLSFVRDDGTTLSVYGGYVDLANGELVVDRAEIVIDGDERFVNQGTGTNTKHYSVTPGNMLNLPRTWATDVISDTLPTLSGDVDVIHVNHRNNDIHVWIPFSATPSQWFADNPTRCVYPLETPITYSLTSTELERALNAIGITCNTYEIAFPSEAGTVREGTLDVTNGKLTVAGPVENAGTYDVTPTNIKLFQGVNNVWADCGQITLQYTDVESAQNILSLQRVSLCDQVSVYCGPIGVSAVKMQVISVDFDVLNERYNSIEMGKAKSTFAETVTKQVIASVDKATKEFVKASAMQAAVDNATKQITGAQDSHIRFIYDASGGLQEIVILDTDDITTATKVWRFNSGGLGYSSNGYAGPYSLAMTQDGAIVADFITTGILNANLLRAGVIQDATGTSYWNLLSGVMNIVGSFTAQGPETSGTSFKMKLEDGAIVMYVTRNSVETEIGRLVWASRTIRGWQARDMVSLRGKQVELSTENDNNSITIVQTDDTSPDGAVYINAKEIWKAFGDSVYTQLPSGSVQWQEYVGVNPDTGLEEWIDHAIAFENGFIVNAY